MAQTLEKDQAETPARMAPERPADQSGELAGALTAAPASGRARGAATASRFLLTVASFVVVVAGMKAAAPLLVSFLLAAFIAVICAPLFLAMQRRGVPSGIALLVLVGLMVGAGVLIGNLLERSLSDVGANLQRYNDALDQQVRLALGWLSAQGFELAESGFRGYLEPEVVLRWFGPIAGRVGDLLVWGLIVVIVAAFILLESAAMPAKVRRLPGLSRHGWERLRQIVADVRRYMLLKTVMSILTGVLVALWLMLLGVDFPILLGGLAFALNYVPNLGSIAASIPGILLALIEFGLGSALLTTFGYVVINVGVSNGIEPRFMGYGLGLSPLIVLTSIIFWGWVLGPLGMLLSVPLTMAIKIALESDEHSRWIALLMSAKPKRSARTTPGVTPGGQSGRHRGGES